eukprot:Phypoly_transcript_09881.p1 GENE.Phypoly_transcript_09881~~Phypoly_transcript_09881.p1  ORF type:complete len:126 (+),score=14.36 Phypoly_transcript_09881:844-1221(+)
MLEVHRTPAAFSSSDNSSVSLPSSPSTFPDYPTDVSEYNVSELSLDKLPQCAEAIHLAEADPVDTTQSKLLHFASELATSGNIQHKQGYLTKQGKIVKNWKRRWFKLESVTNEEMLLCYYRHPEV